MSNADPIIKAGTSCDFVYDTIRNPKYRMHLGIMDKYDHPERRGYFLDQHGDTLNHFLYHQDIAVFAQVIDPKEKGIYRTLTNKVVYLILEQEPKMLDAGLTVWTKPEELEYFMYHVAHPECNTLPVDSVASVIRTQMGEPNDRAKKIKRMLLENLERAEAR